MIDNSLNPKSRSDHFGSKINRTHSPLLALGTPWVSILLASLIPMLPLFPEIPLVPPVAFMMLLGWRFVRPGLLPAWAGMPLGAFDDLFSGHPFGCAVLLWSTTMIAIEMLEARFPWRGFWQDWLTVTVILAIYLVASTLFAGVTLTVANLPWLLPQLLLSIMLFPIIARAIASLDRFRLKRIRRIG